MNQSRNRATSGGNDEPRYRWRVRSKLPERFGQSCRVLIRGRMNTVVVAFDDGFRVATSRWYIRREVRATTAASKGRHAAAARRVR